MVGRSVLGRLVAEYLLERGRITSSQLEEARRTHGFFGGQLETQLLKLGYVSEETLGEALTEISGVPFASWDRLRAASASALGAVPVPLIERHRVCPFRLDDGHLRLATLAPRDAIALKEIASATGLVIQPWIATEPRLYQALDRYYRLRFEGTRGIAMPPERRRIPREPAPETVPDRVQVEVGLDGLPLDAEVSLDEIHRTRSHPREVVEAGSIEALDDALASARDRNQLAQAILAYCSERSKRSGLFAVGRDVIRGLAGRGRGFTDNGIRKLSVPVGSGTIFDTALQSRDFYYGVVPALAPNRELFAALGGAPPAGVMLLPIVLKDRTVALLYLDGDDGPLPQPDISLMRRVAAKTSLAFELLLLRNKLREI